MCKVLDNTSLKMTQIQVIYNKIINFMTIVILSKISLYNCPNNVYYDVKETDYFVVYRCHTTAESN